MKSLLFNLSIKSRWTFLENSFFNRKFSCFYWIFSTSFLYRMMMTTLIFYLLYISHTGSTQFGPCDYREFLNSFLLCPLRTHIHTYKSNAYINHDKFTPCENSIYSSWWNCYFYSMVAEISRITWTFFSCYPGLRVAEWWPCIKIRCSLQVQTVVANTSTMYTILIAKFITSYTGKTYSSICKLIAKFW